MVPRKEEIPDGKFLTEEPENGPAFEEPRKPLVDEQNGSIYLELGEYKSLRMPFYMIFGSLVFYPYLSTFKHDPRMENLPMMHSIFPVFCIGIFYLFFSLVWGPRYMRNRPPFDLKKVKIVYNMVQVVICSYTFIQAGRLGWFWDYSYSCQQIDHSWEGKPFAITRVVYLFFLTKILDLADTVFFILNKKWAHITFLHVFHHGGMVVGMFVGAKYCPGGHGTFMGLVNSFVHVLMYSYYLLAAMGPAVRPYLWWKKYLTIIQLTQFVVVFLHALQVFFIDCPIQKTFQVWLCIYAVVFFYLFMDFYLYSYRKQPKKTEAIPDADNFEAKYNGVHKTVASEHEGLKTE